MSWQVCLAKSPNKHNRLYGIAEPLCPVLVHDIASGSVSFTPEDPVVQAAYLSDRYGFEKEVVGPRRLWAFNGTNCLMYCAPFTGGIESVRPSVCSGFAWVTKEGPLTSEPVGPYIL